jgi:hypothetical protein
MHVACAATLSLLCSHSNLLLAIYEEEGDGDSSSTDGEPVAVLELAMHEVDVDFTATCATLREVAQVGYHLNAATDTSIDASSVAAAVNDRYTLN